MPLAALFIDRDCFSDRGFLCFHMKSKTVLSRSVKNCVEFRWRLHWVCRLLLVGRPLFTVLLLPIHEHGSAFHLPVSSISFFFLKVFIIWVFYLHGVSYQDIFYHLRLLQKVFFPIILSLFDICIQESYGLWGFFFELILCSDTSLKV